MGITLQSPICITYGTCFHNDAVNNGRSMMLMKRPSLAQDQRGKYDELKADWVFSDKER